MAAVVGGAAFFFVERIEQSRGSALPTKKVALSVEEAQKDLDESKALMRDGRYDIACRKLSLLQFRDAYVLGRDVASALADCNLELAAARRVESARELVAVHRYADARKELARVSAGTRAFLSEKEGVERALHDEAVRLISEAQELRSQRTDREAMVALKRVGEQIAEIDPELEAANELQEEADAAIQDIDMPSLAVKRLFDAGDVAGALKKARGCANDVECDELAAPLAKLAAARPKLKTLGTAKLNELYELTAEVSDDDEGVFIAELARLIIARYEAAARKCRAGGDWACVDRQLTLASDLGYEFDDESIEKGLDAFAKDTAMRAYALRGSDPKAATSMIKQLLQLQNIDAKWRSVASRLEQRR